MTRPTPARARSRRASLLALAGAAALAAVASAGLTTPVASAAPAGHAASTPTVRLGGVTVRLRPGRTQAVTVNRTTGHHARVTLWSRRDGRWVAALATSDGRVGYGGLSRPARRRQGDGTTPLGTYDLTSAFGTGRRAARWRLGYHRIRPGDYWVGDNASPYYNRLRNRSRGGFRWRLPASDHNASERLQDYPRQYELALVTSFNVEQVRERGFAIFLHVNGRGATAGCVSVPRETMRRLLGRLDPARHPVVAIGR